MNVKEAIYDIFENYNVGPHTEDAIKADLEEAIKCVIQDAVEQVEWEACFGPMVMSQNEIIENIKEKLLT